MSAIGYSTTIGVSGDMLRVTLGPRALALVNRFRYLKANFRSTGSRISMTTDSSSLSTTAWFLREIDPVPRSPEAENRIPSLVQVIVQVSPSTARSRMMRWNSAEGMRMVQLYSVSGMPRCSDSMSISFSSNSETRSCRALSNVMERESVSSAALSVTTSSLPAHLRILEKLGVFRPREVALSQRYSEKPSARIISAHRETWEESMACMEMPFSVQSRLASTTNSRMASMIFLSVAPCIIFASNIFYSLKKKLN
mmetsp:Transcript_85602/g.184796  ORF Transcript_85602/g.184796 Transcript_85602/m.184796 type:complete len:254 (-) Transcript_85602:24-785(-)